MIIVVVLGKTAMETCHFQWGGLLFLALLSASGRPAHKTCFPEALWPEAPCFLALGASGHRGGERTHEHTWRHGLTAHRTHPHSPCEPRRGHTHVAFALPKEECPRGQVGGRMPLPQTQLLLLFSTQFLLLQVPVPVTYPPLSLTLSCDSTGLHCLLMSGFLLVGQALSKRRAGATEMCLCCSDSRCRLILSFGLCV